MKLMQASLNYVRSQKSLCDSVVEKRGELVTVDQTSLLARWTDVDYLRKQLRGTSEA